MGDAGAERALVHSRHSGLAGLLHVGSGIRMTRGPVQAAMLDGVHCGHGVDTEAAVRTGEGESE